MFACALAWSGCNECDHAGQTISDLKRADAILGAGLDLRPRNWVAACEPLIGSAESLRADADFVREVADESYTSTNPPGCLDVAWVEYCSGGWWRRPYYYGATDRLDQELAQGTFNEDSVRLARDVHMGRPGGGYRPGPAPRPGPGPRPGPAPYPGRPPHWGSRPIPGPWVPIPVPIVYPVYYPHYWARGWDWWYEPRVCRLIPICMRYAPGRTYYPGYEQVMALAYELDQAAGGIELGCRKALEGAPEGEVTALEQEARDRIERFALPGSRAVYDGLGCSR